MFAKKILPLMIIVLMSLPGRSQADKQIGLDSVCVYLEISERGHTTAGAYTHFNDLKDRGIQKMCISMEEKIRLQEIMNRAKQKRHFQRKLAMGLVFCEVSFENSAFNSRVAIWVGSEVGDIMDLSSRKDYLVTEKRDLEWLMGFKNKIEQSL
ncbi:hypothetical protein [Owenweeksia hongkongensis]|nr:hypothetical protein [Owenweeksia hongkongensis]